MGIRALALADVLRSAGLPVVEVPGWRDRGRDLVAIRGGVVHHTATSSAAGGDYPTLGVVRDGRAGIAGPLSQLGLGRSGTWYVIAAGRANHAGAVHARYASTYANPYSLGVEAEHPGGGTPWPAEQYASYVRGCAALARHYGITWLGHKEVAAPAGRKPDPTFDMGAFRANLGTSLVSNPGGSIGGSLPDPNLTPVTPIEEDDMPLNDADKQWIVEAIRSVVKSEGAASAELALRRQFAPGAEVSNRTRALLDERVDLTLRRQFAPEGEVSQRMVALLNAQKDALLGQGGGSAPTPTSGA